MGKRGKRRQRYKSDSTSESVSASSSKSSYGSVLGFFESKYKTLLVIPFLLVVLSLVVLGTNVVTTGDFIAKGISLKGGVSATIPSDSLDAQSLGDHFVSLYPGAEINVRVVEELGSQEALIIETSDVPVGDVISGLDSFESGLSKTAAVEEIGSSLSDSFFRQTLIAVLIAFLFMGLAVLAYFRSFVPSLAVILAAASDIIITLAVISLLGVKLSTAGVAAFLMLIGYSVDTNILLSTRVLKRIEGTVFDRVVSAMKTGLTMSVTTLAAVTVGLIISQSDVLHQIMLIVLIGLVVDMVMTWVQNAGILRWYVERKNES